MKSQPLQTAFTSMTIALVIFLSIWVIQASQEELSDKSHVSLQVKPNSPSSGIKPDSRPDPFDDSVTQAPVLSETSIASNPPLESTPTIERNSIQVRTVSDESPAKPSAQNNPFGIDESIPPLSGLESSSTPPTLELPELNLSPSVEQPVISPSESKLSEEPRILTESSEIERMKQAMAEEAAARNQLQSKIDSLTQEQSKLKSSLQREQQELDLARQEKQSVAEKLGKSESELTRLKTTTRELRSEAVEMKNSLNRVTNEFDSLRKRFEDLQKKPRELSTLAPPHTATTSNIPPPPQVTTQTEEQFKPPIRRDEKPSIPLAPPSDDATPKPLIEADPMFGQSQNLDVHYPPMVACETCTETAQAQPRGLLPKLYRKYKSKNTESCSTCTQSESLAPSCTETGTCEPDGPRRRGLFYRLRDLMHKDDSFDSEVCTVEASPDACGCGCHEQKKRGLIPKVARWIEARNTFGCYNECCCGSY